MNYFETLTAAERYAKGRPYFHDLAIAHIKEFLKISKVDKALDVACGTGLSSKALLAMADTVYGTDASEHMLQHAAEKNRIHYSAAPAGQQPFSTGSFDLLTVCSGVHWFDIDRFLNEAERLLKSKGWLVLYDNFFLGEMEGAPGFKDWFTAVYLQKFPAPVRNNQYDWNNSQLAGGHLKTVHEERFTNTIRFNKTQLILYFTTQSNVGAAVESGSTSYAAAEQWLSDELDTFFNTAHTQRNLTYGNWIKYIQKTK